MIYNINATGARVQVVINNGGKVLLKVWDAENEQSVVAITPKMARDISASLFAAADMAEAEQRADRAWRTEHDLLDSSTGMTEDERRAL